MAVVGEMHVGKGREEKGKGKTTRASEGAASQARCARRAHLVRDTALRRMRDAHAARISRATCAASHARCARHAHLAYDMRAICAQARNSCAHLASLARACGTKRQCVLLP